MIGPTEIAGRLPLGEDAMPTCLLEMTVALLASALETAELVTLAVEAEDATVVEEGRMVVMETPDSVAMLDRKLEACEGSRVNVSVGAVDVGATVTVTVMTEPVLLLTSVDEAVADADEALSEAVVDWDDLCVRVDEALVSEAEVETGTEAVDDSEPEASSTESLSSSPLQSTGSSTGTPVLLTAIPPVAPVALMMARAVVFVVQEISYEE